MKAPVKVPRRALGKWLVTLVTAGLTAAACSRPAREATASGATAAGDVRAAAGVVPDASAGSVYDIGSAWTDQDGRERPIASLAGKVRVVAMVYTHCSTTCPMVVDDMKRVAASLPGTRRGDVGFVLVSLDPARDHPERLREFARDHALDGSWTLLTASDDEVRELAAALGVRYEPVRGGEHAGEIVHSNAITVLDTAGVIIYQQAGLGGAAEVARVVVATLP